MLGRQAGVQAPGGQVGSKREKGASFNHFDLGPRHGGGTGESGDPLLAA